MEESRRRYNERKKKLHVDDILGSGKDQEGFAINVVNDIIGV